MVDFKESNVLILVDMKSGLVKFELSNPNLVFDKPYRLGRNELLLLIALFESLDVPLSRVELIKRCWVKKFVTDNTLSVSVSKLRKLLSIINCHDDLKTINCYGYMLAPEVANYQKVTTDKLEMLVISKL
ncbi:winged helix-turn-helix domain-containing protein [Shewanella xiamenensis]|uniref:winged helix-turn-helix domain-containing protein n=1 Tax=Shewanella xiamenensis TaxID=332186 RepID=UPI0035B816BF